MKFYVVIPARYDSSRFPGKVLAQINGKSMLEIVFNNAMESNALEVYIATDSELVYETAKKFTENVYMTSSDNRNGTERVAEIARILDWDHGDLVINLQADLPELKCDNINLLAKKSINFNGLTTLYYNLSSKDLLRDRDTVKIHINKEKINFFRDTDITDMSNIYKHIGIYAYTVKDLYLYCELPKSKSEINLSLEQFRFLDNGINIMAYCASSNPGASIDSADNLNEIKGINNWIKTKNLY